ncbi:unnamed protein product [Meloidogyne enterolobii]|uniref:Uncharacterized protein n=2 Tax=Meloidogyne enterolobii TaxID=390850 RepID=A0ACB0XWU0_MELEN
MEESCMIDVNSWKSLDLIQIDSKPKKGVINSLFDVINSCVTPGGTKTLRSYLLQPSANCQTINKRLDIVEELVLNQSMCSKIRAVLSTLSDLQYMISMFSYTNLSNNNLGKEDSKRIIRNKIGQAVSLKNMLDAVEKLGFIMSQSSLSFFVENKMVFLLIKKFFKNFVRTRNFEIFLDLEISEKNFELEKSKNFEFFRFFEIC